MRMFGLAEGQVIGSFNASEGTDGESNEDTVTSLAASPDVANDFVITSHKSGLLRMWNREGKATNNHHDSRITDHFLNKIIKQRKIFYK